VTAQQLRKRLVLRVQAPLASFNRVGGPTRGGETLRQQCVQGSMTYGCARPALVLFCDSCLTVS
jgi:hypothetical protein